MPSEADSNPYFVLTIFICTAFDLATQQTNTAGASLSIPRVQLQCTNVLWSNAPEVPAAAGADLGASAGAATVGVGVTSACNVGTGVRIAVGAGVTVGLVVGVGVGGEGKGEHTGVGDCETFAGPPTSFRAPSIPPAAVSPGDCSWTQSAEAGTGAAGKGDTVSQSAKHSAETVIATNKLAVDLQVGLQRPEITPVLGKCMLKGSDCG